MVDFGKGIGNERSKRFLVVSTTAIGDTLMGTPALRALRESFPESKIDVLVNAQKREILLGNPHITRILTYRNNAFYRGFLFLKALGLYYDHVLVFHAHEDIWKILKKVRYGDCYNRQNYEDVTRRVFLLDSLPRHSIQKRLALVEKVGGISAGNYHYDYLLPSKQIQWATEQLAKWGVAPGERIVGMQLGATDLFKCWPVEFFAEVARNLHAHYGVKIYLNAFRREKNLVHRFRKIVGDGYILQAVSTNLSQAAALIQACSVFISIDTGPMHLAIALGVPLIGLFCPTMVEDTGPLEYSRAIVIRKPLLCDPCLTRKCTDNFCMRQISVEEVCLAAKRILRGDLWVAKREMN